jgi:hypothetical protein
MISSTSVKAACVLNGDELGGLIKIIRDGQVGYVDRTISHFFVVIDAK